MNKKILLFSLLLVIPFVLALKGEIEGDFYADNIIADDPDAQIKFYGGSGMKWAVGTSGGASDNFIIYDYGSSSTRLTINDSNGDVGIGTSSPTQKLHVQGNLNVTGDIYYDGALVSYSPMVVESAHKDKSIICMKADDDKFVGLYISNVDGSYTFKIDETVCQEKLNRINARRNCEEQEGKIWDYEKEECVS